jgi:hypothetical protein
MSLNTRYIFVTYPPKIRLWMLIPVPCCYESFYRFNTISMQCMIISKDSIPVPAGMFKIGTHPTLVCTCNKNNQELLHGSIVCLRDSANKCDNFCIPTHLQCTGGRQSQFSISDASNSGRKIT